MDGRKIHLRAHVLLIEPPSTLTYSQCLSCSSISSSSTSDSTSQTLSPTSPSTPTPSPSPTPTPSSFLSPSLRVFFHTEHEVRIAANPLSFSPSSSLECDDFDDRKAHITNGAGGADTKRILLADVADLAGITPLLDKWLCEFFAAVSPALLSAIQKERESPLALPTHSNVPFCLTKFAFSALDLMLDERGRIWILEVNASPGVAAKDHVDSRFKDHLIRMGRDVYDHLLFGNSSRFKEIPLTS